VTEVDPERLRERYVEALVHSWPEHPLSAEDLRTSLTLDVAFDDDGPLVCIDFLGIASRLPFDTEAEALAAVVADARSTAQSFKIDQQRGWL
jgi:hypothetical protein